MHRTLSCSIIANSLSSASQDSVKIMHMNTVRMSLLLGLLLLAAFSQAAAIDDGSDKRFIKPDPMRLDLPSCSKPRGQTGNCRPQKASGYHRGCSKINKCRGGDDEKLGFIDGAAKPRPFLGLILPPPAPVHT